MEIEYSNEVKGKFFAYRFTRWEEQSIADALRSSVKKLRIKIEKIRNHPKNEGQATYSAKIDELMHQINSLEYIINTFSEQKHE
jgi:hypothetical protein